ncbi:MAG TPA: DUF4282 domain-containing protein [Tepidisphaeraceae bacterium]|jgi:hypothetical protein
MNLNEILSFRKMITPLIVQVVFVVGLIANALSALGIFIASLTTGSIGPILAGTVLAIVTLILGSLLIRIYCELLILAFKIYDELKAIRTGTPPPGDVAGFPIFPSGGSPQTSPSPAVPPIA